jgi:GntR family transcriptional regulator
MTSRREPLYVKARQHLVDRIRTGQWSQGTLLPNEFEIAADLGMSQGTVRKALDQMTAEGLIVRRQGRGTFVADRTPEQWQFRFFNFYDTKNQRILPESMGARSIRRLATAEERRCLRLDSTEDVVAIARVRLDRGRPFLIERMVLPAARFPDLEHFRPIPNTIYDHLRRAYTVIVVRAEERLSATLASRSDCKRLGIAAGTPLLRVDRIAYDIEDKPVEWRQSRLNLGGGHYLAHLK